MIVDGLAEDNALFHSDEKGWAPLADQFLIVAPRVSFDEPGGKDM